MERRLAAILAADVVGYATLMEADEAGTLQRLTRLRQEFLEPLIAEHRGRIVKLMGDGLLVEFRSVVDAAACALAWHAAVKAQETEREAQKRLRYRIGINLGDVIVEGDDIYGDGVNIAARLESLAQPGGIFLSGDAYRQIRGKVDAHFEDLGKRKIKNIAEPVRVWRWSSGEQDEGKGAAIRGATVTEGHVPVIAVLPFENLGRDESVDEFASGLTDEIITAFSRQTGMTVLALGSTRAIKEKAVNFTEIGHKLGANYVLQGSVRMAGSRIRVAAQLVDADSGNHLWGDQLDGELTDVFALQDEVTFCIVAATRSQIHVKDAQRVRDVPEDQLSDNELLALASQKMQSLGVDDHLEAARLSGLVVERNPRNAMALAMRASCILLENENDYRKLSDNNADYAFGLIDRSIQINEESDYGHYVRGKLLLYARRAHDLAIAEAERALVLNPNYTYAYALLGFALTCGGDAAQGIPLIEKALRADPRRARNVLFFEYLGICKFVSGDYAIAQTWVEKAAQRTGYLPYLRMLLAVFHAAQKQQEQARAHVLAALEAAPEVTLGSVKCPPFRNRADTDGFFDRLRQAGIPE